jgi:hypothetical protein
MTLQLQHLDRCTAPKGDPMLLGFNQKVSADVYTALLRLPPACERRSKKPERPCLAICSHVLTRQTGNTASAEQSVELNPPVGRCRSCMRSGSVTCFPLLLCSGQEIYVTEQRGPSRKRRCSANVTMGYIAAKARLARVRGCSA